MFTENLVKNIMEAEEIIKIHKENMEILISEIENKKSIMENINFDFENLYEITREISDNYCQLNRLQRRINDRQDEINYYLEKLENSITEAEFRQKEKLAQMENLKNLDKNLTEIKEIFENKFEEIKILENGLYFSNTAEKYYKNSLYKNKKYKYKKWVEVNILSDNSYQFKTAEKNINIKRKSTIIKYISQFIMA